MPGPDQWCFVAANRDARDIRRTMLAHFQLLTALPARCHRGTSDNWPQAIDCHGLPVTMYRQESASGDE